MTSHSATVTTRRLAYTAGSVSLCADHERAYRYPLGPATHGAHAGLCDECARIERLSIVSMTDIQDLRDEAREHGDETMVTICQAALRGDERAAAECRRVILAARAEREASR